MKGVRTARDVIFKKVVSRVLGPQAKKNVAIFSFHWTMQATQEDIGYLHTLRLRFEIHVAGLGWRARRGEEGKNTSG